MNGLPAEPTVDEAIAAFATPDNTAVLSTLLPSGHPQSHVVWVSYADGTLLVNTERHRQKHRNVQRDPRVTVLLIDGRDPHRFVEVRGHVTEIVFGGAARAHVDSLSRRYRGVDYDPAAITSERVLLRVTPRRCVYVTGAVHRSATIGGTGGSVWSAPVHE